MNLDKSLHVAASQKPGALSDSSYLKAKRILSSGCSQIVSVDLIADIYGFTTVEFIKLGDEPDSHCYLEESNKHQAILNTMLISPAIEEFNILDWNAEHSSIDTLGANADYISFYSLLDGQGSDVFRVTANDSKLIAKHFKLTSNDLK